MRKLFGIICIVFSIVFGWQETKYFGNNFFPQSNAEIMCDLATLMIAISGHIIFWSKYNNNRNSEKKNRDYESNRGEKVFDRFR